MGLRAEGDPPMPVVSIPLRDDQVRELGLRADQARIPLEAYRARSVGELLDRSADEFRVAAERVMEKHAELSRRMV